MNFSKFNLILVVLSFFAFSFTFGAQSELVIQMVNKRIELSNERDPVFRAFSEKKKRFIVEEMVRIQLTCDKILDEERQRKLEKIMPEESAQKKLKIA